jgi:hypothetical protein
MRYLKGHELTYRCPTYSSSNPPILPFSADSMRRASVRSGMNQEVDIQSNARARRQPNVERQIAVGGRMVKGRVRARQCAPSLSVSFGPQVLSRFCLSACSTCRYW